MLVLVSLVKTMLKRYKILLHPSPTDSRNTGAFIARQRPGYHNIKESKRMRHSSSFRGSFRPTTFSINFFLL